VASTVKVAKILLFALGICAQFQVAISVQLSNAAFRDAASSMQAIHVGGDEEFHYSFLENQGKCLSEKIKKDNQKSCFEFTLCI
jgi:hypothetical protein